MYKEYRFGVTVSYSGNDQNKTLIDVWNYRFRNSDFLLARQILLLSPQMNCLSPALKWVLVISNKLLCLISGARWPRPNEPVGPMRRVMVQVAGASPHTDLQVKASILNSIRAGEGRSSRTA